jgi:hypothetical protein
MLQVPAKVTNMSNRPTPSELRKLSGVHLDRVNKREPCFRTVDAVKEPAAVARDPYAHEEWMRVIQERTIY